MCEIILNASSSYARRSARSRILRRIGYCVIEASNELETLQLAGEKKPHLIVISDLDAAGPEVCRRLKDNPATAQIPIVAICSPRGRRQWSRKCGLDLLLPETVPYRALASMIALLLRSASTAGARAHGAAAAQGGEPNDPAEIHDIVRLKRELEASVNELARENERLLRCNQDLSGSVPLKAHDLLSPLCTISFVSAWIAGEYSEQLGVNGREYFKLLEKSVERVMGVVNRVTVRSQASDRPKVA